MLLKVIGSVVVAAILWGGIATADESGTPDPEAMRWLYDAVAHDDVEVAIRVQELRLMGLYGYVPYIPEHDIE